MQGFYIKMISICTRSNFISPEIESRNKVNIFIASKLHRVKFSKII